METGILAQVSRASLLLAQASTAIEAKQVADMTKAAEVFATKQKSEEAKHHAHCIYFDALRLEGHFLKQQPKAIGGQHGGRKRNDGVRRTPSNRVRTLKQHGITKNESKLAQRVYEVSETMPEAFRAIREGEKTLTEVIRQLRRAKAKQKVASIPFGKFRVLYADPPWKYGDSRESLDGTTGSSAHYPSMTISELCHLPIEDKTAEDAVLFLWVTSPLLEECFHVIKAWGFKYKASFVWDKVKHNLGHYNSVRHEFLLLCTRGSCLPDTPKLFDSVQVIERSDRHSEKPEEFRDIIETLYPHGRKLELFARKKSKGWEVYGNEC